MLCHLWHSVKRFFILPTTQRAARDRVTISIPFIIILKLLLFSRILNWLILMAHINIRSMPCQLWWRHANWKIIENNFTIPCKFSLLINSRQQTTLLAVMPKIEFMRECSKKNLCTLYIGQKARPTLTA